jgi:beta-lactamase superfamily II metal-dependent hydrolase
MTDLFLRVFDVEHGACAMLALPDGGVAMIDSGHNETTGWRPSTFIRYTMGLNHLDHLFVQNADNDHLSDLHGLTQHGIHVGTLHRNPTHDPGALRSIKSAGTTPGIDRFIAMCGEYNAPVPQPTLPVVNGVTYTAFWNPWPWFWETNDLSLVLFIKYGPFKILFPGDLEQAGWQNLLRVPAFVEELRGTTILVASHHGRKSGFCRDIFKYFVPSAVVISDKPVMHLTQEVDYSSVANPLGVHIVNQSRRRHVLTTRRDGDIIFRVRPDGWYWIGTQKDYYALRVA